MMKIWPVLFAAVLLVGCATKPALTAVGRRDAAGVPGGEFRIVNAAGSTQAQGRFQNGKMHGPWVFLDSRRVKVAEVTYQEGNASGPYRTFFGSFALPKSVSNLQSEGRLQNGRVVGTLTVYNPDGTSVYSRAVFGADGPSRVLIGPPDAPARFAANDQRFVQTLETIVRDAMR